MNKDTVLAALHEAQRFIEKAEVAFEELNGKNWPDHTVTAAAKRASMDLTRALEKMRKAG